MGSKVRFIVDERPDSQRLLDLELRGSRQVRVRRVAVPGGVNGGDEQVPVTKHELDLPDFGDQVNRGIVLLNGITPGWADRVDLVKLDLEDTESCVLGQTYADNEWGIPGYDFEVKTYMEEFKLDPAEYGFNLTDSQVAYLNHITLANKYNVRQVFSLAWEHLADTWRAEIRAREEAPSHV